MSDLNQNELLLEIGTEEIPARFGPIALTQLKANTTKALEEARLDFTSIKVYGTPRRLIVYVEGLAERQRDVELVQKGPSKKVAFDAAGEPTVPAQKFAQSQNIAVSDLEVRADEKGGEYIFARRLEKGRAPAEILPNLLATLVLSIDWPKSMRWAEHTIAYARPIKWLLALLNDTPLSFNIDGIATGQTTLGHRVLGPRGPLTVQNPRGFFLQLKEAFVLYDQTERQEIIWTQIQKEGAVLEGVIYEDADLLEEIAWLVEYPTAFSGSFDPGFIDVPSEVLVTTMKENQRYFPVYRETSRQAGSPISGVRILEKELLPNFIAVRNGGSDALATVRAGNEKVLAARLSDARFFWNEDRKRPLAAFNEKLKSAVFQEKLGTQYQRVERITRLSAAIAPQVGTALGLAAPEQAELTRQATEAAQLCKADLTTRMVFEFPEVQGYMGQQYFLRENGDPAVANAIYEHYLPRGAGDDLPRTPAGIVLALADKLDALAGYFSIGEIPSGSKDPYALRRAAQGVIQTIVENDLHLDLAQLGAAAVGGYNLDAATGAKTASELRDFLRARLKVLMEGRKLRYDVIEAVLSTRENPIYGVKVNDPPDMLTRAEALAEMLQSEDFAAVTSAFKRVTNLAVKASEVGVPPGDVNPSLFLDPPEHALYNAFHDLRPGMEEALKIRAYKDFYGLAVNLKAPVDLFLDKVLVNTENEETKANRYRLLSLVGGLLSAPANLAKLAG